MMRWLKALRGTEGLQTFQSVMYSMLTREQRAELDRTVGSPVRLAERVARLIGASEADVLQRAGMALDVPLVKRVPECPGDGVPASLRHALKEAGALPLIRDGKIVGLIGSNTDLIRPLGAQYSVPLALACWRQIDEAWTGPSLKPSISNADKTQEIVRALWAEVQRYAGSEVEVLPGSGGLTYRFRARARAEWGVEGREACGTINAPEVLSWLRQAVSEPILLSGVDESGSLRVREESSTGGVVLYRERRPAKDEPSPEEPNEPVVTGAAQEILLVEDNPSIATVLKKMLAKTGATCRWFPDGASALEALMAGHVKPDVLLCDIHMPEMDGVTFVRRARLLPELRDTPILMLTSDEALETEVRSLKSGADAFVGKSEDPKVLLGYVERMLLRSARRTAA